MIRIASRRSGEWSLLKLAELIQNPSSSKATLSAATSSCLRESNVNGTIPFHSFPGGARFLSSGRFREDDSSSRSAASTRTLSSGSKVFPVCAAVSEVGRRSLLSANRREVGLPVPTARQFSSSALAVEEDETVRLAAEIGYEVLGQYVPEGPRINPQSAFAVVQVRCLKVEVRPDYTGNSQDLDCKRFISIQSDNLKEESHGHVREVILLWDPDSRLREKIGRKTLSVGSHQFKVTPGDMIYTEKLKYADINDKLLLNKVLLMGSLEKTIIGRPTIPEAGVLAAVEEIALDAKVIVFKKKRRKNYRRTNGHRQELTRLRILQIEGIEAPASPSNDNVQLEESPV